MRLQTMLALGAYALGVFLIGCSSFRWDHERGGHTVSYGLSKRCFDLKMQIMQEVGVRDLDEACSLSRDPKRVPDVKPFEGCMLFKDHCQGAS